MGSLFFQIKKYKNSKDFMCFIKKILTKQFAFMQIIKHKLDLHKTTVLCTNQFMVVQLHFVVLDIQFYIKMINFDAKLN